MSDQEKSSRGTDSRPGRLLGFILHALDHAAEDYLADHLREREREIRAEAKASLEQEAAKVKSEKGQVDELREWSEKAIRKAGRAAKRYREALLIVQDWFGEVHELLEGTPGIGMRKVNRLMAMIDRTCEGLPLDDEDDDEAE